jgi:hypothetical protein
MYEEDEEEERTLYSFQNEWNDYYSDRGYFAWGSSIETMYNIFGVFAFADEHWAHPDYDGDGEISERERLRWNDEEMDGSQFVDWHSFDHPTLGEVEIGGWIRRRNSPPEGPLVQAEAEMGNAYKLYMAGLTPRLKVKSEVTATNEAAGIYQVDITVENTGFLHTALQQARVLGVVEPVILTVEGDDDLEILFGEEKLGIGHINGQSESEPISYVVRKRNASSPAVLAVAATAQRALNAWAEVVIRLVELAGQALRPSADGSGGGPPARLRSRGWAAARSPPWWREASWPGCRLRSPPRAPRRPAGSTGGAGWATEPRWAFPPGRPRSPSTAPRSAGRSPAGSPACP